VKRFLLVPGLGVAFIGCLVLLPLLAWASLDEPGLTGTDYLLAVVGRLLVGRAGWSTLGGTAAIVLGLAMALYSTLLAETEGRERREALPIFWAVLAGGVLAVFALLAVVNYLALEAGTPPGISGWVNR
jgi:hypothetical protein